MFAGWIVSRRRFDGVVGSQLSVVSCQLLVVRGLGDWDGVEG